MSILSLFIAICVVLALSLVISIFNVILQARITSRITLLEKELEKKTLIFDSLKKERASFDTQALQGTPAVDMATHLEVPTESQLVDDGEIRVVRNVRGMFAPVTEDQAPDSATEIQIESTPIATAGNVPAHTASPAAAAPTDDFPDDTKRWQQGVHFDASRSPSPAVTPQVPPMNDTPVVITLFSQASGGADFNALYDKLIAALKIRSTQSIAFDCGGIQYLNGPELEYLGKIYQSLIAQNRTLQLVNCSRELEGLLQQQQNLASLIR